MLEWDDRSSLRGANEAIRRRISWCAFQNGEITESRSASTLTVRATPLRGVYADGTYLEQNPTWHEEDSPWKAAQIRLMLQKHPLQIQSVAEIGCGVGAILAELCQTLPRDVECHGFDIAPEAIAGAKQRENDQLHFHLQDLLSADAFFDLLLLSTCRTTLAFWKAAGGRRDSSCITYPWTFTCLPSFAHHSFAVASPLVIFTTSQQSLP